MRRNCDTQVLLVDDHLLCGPGLKFLPEDLDHALD